VKAVPNDRAHGSALSALLEALFLDGQDADAELARSVSRGLWSDALLAPLHDFLARPSKGFRAGLVDLGYRLSGGSEGRVPPELPLIIECLHAGSLIIDDIEDESLERRGAPALHRTNGVPRALNAGNWLYFWPQVLLRRLGLAPLSRLAAHERIHLCLLRCHEGQALDLQVRVDGLPQREVVTVTRTVARLKTGGLLGLAAALGAIAADAPEERVDALAAFGRELGVALQMLDDLSGVLNAARRHKAMEDLRQARCTWVWAFLSEELEPAPYDALIAELRTLREGRAGDALIERMRFRIGHVGVRRAREHVRAAALQLASVLGHGSWFEAQLEQFAWLEKRYVQG
jgi:geranylgeranyl pyrophosphate synthase